MLKPTLARSAVARLSIMLFATAALAGCAGDVTSAPRPTLHTQDATKALLGLIDGVYVLTVDPRVDAVMNMGPNHLNIPANSICSLAASGYGPSFWDAPCTPESQPVTITAIVRNASTNNPSIEFQPALRFNPATTVSLTLFVTNAATLSNMAVVKYCGVFAPTCVDESLNDPSMKTTLDRTAGSVSRRIKHFSGYVVAE